jgi:DNA-binding response OmpR family regulator
MGAKKKLIMIVDDEPHILDLVKVTLGDEYEFVEAREAEEVFEKVKEHKPDLILLDIMLPGMDGFQICQRLRSDPATRDVVIAMLSAKKEDHDILTGIDVGAVAYITKPFNPYELQEKVRELLEIGSE